MAKLFNMLVDAVAREWFFRLQLEWSIGPYLAETMWSFFAIFYADITYLALRDPMFLQMALDIMVEFFERVGLETNRLKMQAVVCIPGRIQTQLPTASYHHMQMRYQASKQWEALCVTCHHSDTEMQAHSLPRHLAIQHGVYQQNVVA